MKLFKVMVAVLATGLMFVSCKKDDDALKESNLVGKWKATELSWVYYEDGIKKSSETDFFIDHGRYFQFNANGTGQDLYTAGNASETYAIKSWLLMGDELILTFEDDYYNENYRVEELTSTTMKLTVTEELIEEGVKLKGVYYYTFVKI